VSRKGSHGSILTPTRSTANGCDRASPVERADGGVRHGGTAALILGWGPIEEAAPHGQGGSTPAISMPRASSVTRQLPGVRGGHDVVRIARRDEVDRGKAIAMGGFQRLREPMQAGILGNAFLSGSRRRIGLKPRHWLDRGRV
jgi:hypothetical protein